MGVWRLIMGWAMGIWRRINNNAPAIEAISTIVLVAITITYVNLTHNMANTMKEEQEVMNRGYIGIAGFRHDDDDAALLKALLKNYGNAPAKITKRIIRVDDEISPFASIPMTVGDIILFPSEERWMRLYTFSDKEDHEIMVHCDYETVNQRHHMTYRMKHNCYDDKTIALSVDAD